jgi:hypothetical protein
MIKFSGHFKKMPLDYESSMLLEVFVVSAETLSQAFVNYDATKDDGTFYRLPKHGRVLVLLLCTSVNKELWTTVRRFTPVKHDYYRGLIGTIQECNIVEVKS